MKSIICTLFEGNYHYGVAALVNSLYAKGFRGHIYAGYKGILPKWADGARPNLNLDWDDALTLTLSTECFIHFLPIETDYHLTNYKPNFMLDILSGCGRAAEAIFYFDPDIVVKCDWSFFNKWIESGIALVHEINMNDMPKYHPVRMIWKNVLNDCGLKVSCALNSYINGGFIGLKTENKIFLENWRKIMDCGFEKYGMKPQQFAYNGLSRSHPFYAQDQDGLNMAAMVSEVIVCDAGPEFMDFLPGGLCMSHALGSPKPWCKNYIGTFLINASPPSLADKNYWLTPNHPCERHHKLRIQYEKIMIKITSFLARFYSR